LKRKGKRGLCQQKTSSEQGDADPDPKPGASNALEIKYQAGMPVSSARERSLADPGCTVVYRELNWNQHPAPFCPLRS
jgi:hypothetical protein